MSDEAKTIFECDREEVNRRCTSGILGLIGNTPLVPITRLGPKSDKVRIFAKLEGHNPGGSVKDRPALNMVRKGILDGRFSADKILLDSTSGNTGIAYAMIGAYLGFPVYLTLPANASSERKNTLYAYGATVQLTDPLEGSDGAIIAARELLEGDPDRYFKPDQYNNPDNFEAHILTTGPEILEQTEGAVTHIVASIGTSGTVMGCKKAMEKHSPGVKVLAVEPDDAFHGIEGLKHMGSSIVPDIYKESELDGKLPVATDRAYDFCRELARTEGILVGQSSGAALVGALNLADQIESGVIVAIFPDNGGKYLTTPMWAQGGGI